MKAGIGSHHSPRAGKDEWLTPPEIVNAFGPFDLDPCSPINRPWDTAANHLTIRDNGLSTPWIGRVWCNPPYGQQTGKWLQKCAEHGNCIALVFARTETADWHDWIWTKASGILFLRGRLFFHHVDGTRAKHNSGAPSALVAYDNDPINPVNIRALRKMSNCGKLVEFYK